MSVIVDAHLDLGYSAIRFARDLTQPLDILRQREAKYKSRPNGIATVTLPELRRGGVGIVFASLFCMPARYNKQLPGRTALTYTTPAEAQAAAMQQLDYYHRLADEHEWVRLVRAQSDVEAVLASHAGEALNPELGIVVSMEGADPILEPEALEEWVERGLRVIGPAWTDTRYAAGAWEGGGGFTRDGQLLMDIMADLNLTLDITHLSEQASFEALERYGGRVVATHCNVRHLVDGERQLSDAQIRAVGERDGVIGNVLFNRFLKADYAMTDPRESVTLDHIVAHIDHICQLLGNARHVGIGSDMDGGFGWADIPGSMNSVADLGQVGTALKERGYAEADINDILGGNWIRLLRETLP